MDFFNSLNLKKILTPNFIFVFVLSFLWILYIWGIYLFYRQYKVCKNNLLVPKEVKTFMDQNLFDKARLYFIDKSIYSFIHRLWSHILTNLILIFFIIPYVWNISGNILKYFFSSAYEINQSLVFILLTSIFSLIIDLPWSLYYEFVLEEKHGFNKYTLYFYLTDKLKKLVVYQAILLPLIALAIHIIKIGGDYFFLYLWVFCSIICLILLTVYPDYIAPLFDKFIPIPECQLKEKIKSFSSLVGYPLKSIYIVEGSKRSFHSNAYLYGMFKNKKIVLFDTLIDKSVIDLTDFFKKKSNEDNKNEVENDNNQNEKNDKEVTELEEKKETEIDDKKESLKEKKPEGCNEEEILAVLCHEFGHWKLNHIIINLIISEINMLFTFSVFGFLYQNDTIFAAFGFYNEKPIIIGLTIIFEYIFLPYNEIMNFLMTCLTRKFEFQADDFAKKLGKAEDLKKALIKLNHNNLSFPIYDWLYSACNHSHPPLLERIASLGKSE